MVLHFKYYFGLVTREGDKWLIEFPDLPGCCTFAESYEELLSHAAEALEGRLEVDLDYLTMEPPVEYNGKEYVKINIPEKLSKDLNFAYCLLKNISN